MALRISLFAIIFTFCLIGGEILILELVPLHSIDPQDSVENPGNKKEYCSEIAPWRPYTFTAQRYACVFAFKNLIFFDAYHDTINALSALFVAFFTFTLWRSTDKLWQASKTQSLDMRDSIAEAGRSALAMEELAKYMRAQVATSANIMERQKQYISLQLRAYVFANDASLFEGTIITPPQEDRRNVPGIVITLKTSAIRQQSKLSVGQRLPFLIAVGKMS